jgi:hypothetical protein
MRSVKRAQPLKRSGARFFPLVFADFRSFCLHDRFIKAGRKPVLGGPIASHREEPVLIPT